jgi:hypothetical protein
MELINRKRVLKKNSPLIFLLGVCGSYLACASCEGMEKQDNPNSNKQYKRWSYGSDESTEAGEEGTYCEKNEEEIKSSASIYKYSQGESIESLGTLYEYSQSETFLEEWADIINGSKTMPKSNRRVPVGFLDEKELEKGALRAPVKRNDLSDKIKKEKNLKKKGL